MRCTTRAGTAVIAFSLIAAPLLGMPVLQEADVTGEWVLTMETPNGAQDMNVTFAQEGTEVTGTIVFPQGEQELTGSVEGNALSFSVSVDTPNGVFELAFSSTVEENKTMSGMMSAGGGQFEAPFTGAKAE